jgi:hypothetical protein
VVRDVHGVHRVGGCRLRFHSAPVLVSNESVTGTQYGAFTGPKDLISSARLRSTALRTR